MGLPNRARAVRSLAACANALAGVAALLAFHALPLRHEWQVTAERLDAVHAVHAGRGQEVEKAAPSASADDCGHGHPRHDGATCPVCQWLAHASPSGLPAPETPALVRAGGPSAVPCVQDLPFVRHSLRVPDARGPPAAVLL